MLHFSQGGFLMEGWRDEDGGTLQKWSGNVFFCINTSGHPISSNEMKIQSVASTKEKTEYFWTNKPLTANKHFS